MKIEKININNIKEYENNAKEHPNWQIEQIKNSILEFGFNDPIAIDENNVIIEGHGRYIALKELGYSEVEIIRLSHLTETQKKAYIIAHNKLTMNTNFDMEKLEKEMKELENMDFNLEVMGFNDYEINNILESSNRLIDKYKDDKEEYLGNLSKFIIPPFSVINSTKKEWLEIKQKWRDLFDSKKGRGSELIGYNYGTSEFDGAIAEVFYKWYIPNNEKDNKILDLFAGGVVRGAVAELLGYNYIGFDVRKEQIEINNKISKNLKINPKYILDSSENLDNYIENESIDLIFTCPPYANLEVYSDLKEDISNKEYSEFIKLYESIISKGITKLKENRFAIFVVGDIRDKNGNYYGFIKDTITIFQKYGMNLYNEVIYIEPLGSAPIRTGKFFNTTRKQTKIHQNILVFYKGDTKEIKNNFSSFYENDYIENID